MKDLMIDLETFGNAQGSVIRSVGALVFDRYSDRVGAEFYMNIDEASCLERGLTKDPETVAWWETQPKAARDALLVDPRPMDEVASAFCAWYDRQPGLKAIWSQGGNYDEPLWSWFLKAAGCKRVPWKFWESRCTRTIYDASGFNIYSVKRAGTHHNALEDCRHQVICVQRSFALLRGRML
jgi:hypothetical protein